jgi:plastocyanin
MHKLALAFVAALTLGGGNAALATGGVHPTAVAYAAHQYPEVSTPTPEPARPAKSAVPTPAASPLSIIHIKNFAFVPDTVTIPAGSTVRFVQDDETPHTVTATDKSYDSGNLNQKATWSHTFATEGTYTYVCAYHPSMRGKVVVVK